MNQTLYKFFAVNRELCIKIEPYLPQAKVNIVDLYDKVVAQHLNMKANQITVDVGGGRRCSFANYREPTQKAKIIAVDISEEELKHNTDADETRVANVAQRLPFEAEEVDLIVSRMVLEHLEDVEGFVADSRRTLKKGGWIQPVGATRDRFWVLSGPEVHEWRDWVVPEDCRRRARRRCGSAGGPESP